MRLAAGLILIGGLMVWASPRMHVETWSLSKFHGRLIVKVNYPQVGGLGDAAVEQRINKALRAGVIPGTAELKDMSDDMQEAPTARYDEDRSGQVRVLNGQILSVFYQGLGVRTPSAHPSKFFNDVTLYCKDGRPVRLADLFAPGADYKTRLTALAQKDLEKHYGLSADATPFQEGWHFYLEPHHIVFYEVLGDAFAVANVSATVNIADVQDIAAPDGPLSTLR